VANHLCSSEIHFDLNMNEHLWVKLKLSTDYLIVGSVYRSPSVNSNNSTTELCDLSSKVINTKPAYLLIIGDFWNSMT